jgi:Protein of unknown function (DUF3108)
MESKVRLSVPGFGRRYGRQVCFAGLVMACLAGGEAGAQGKLDARYTASLAGVAIGKGAWVVEIGDDQFTAAASGMTTGLLRVFATGQGSGASRGLVRGDNLIPTTYASSVNNDKRVEELRIVLSAGNVKDLMVEPPTVPNPARIPLTDAHRRGVTDPMSAGLMRVAGSGDPVSPEACRRTIPVFDGRMRFDLHLSFKRLDKVQAEKGYQGPVAVCAVQFVPVAGYVPDRAAIKYLMAQREMEMWLAPIAGTRIVVPYRLSLQTPLGQGVLEATQFITAANPPRMPPATAAR